MADKIEDQGERPSSLKENSLPFQESLWSEVELSYDRKVRTHLASWKFNAAITYTNRFLTGEAKIHFEAATYAASSSGGGISDWPSACTFLLRTFAADSNIRLALSEAKQLGQKTDEKENAFLTRFESAQ